MHIDEHEDPTATTFAVAHQAQFNSLSSQRCAKLRMAFSFNNTCIAKCDLHLHLIGSRAKFTASVELTSQLLDNEHERFTGGRFSFPSTATGLGQIKFLRAIIGQH